MRIVQINHIPFLECSIRILLESGNPFFAEGSPDKGRDEEATKCVLSQFVWFEHELEQCIFGG
ncbi:hypothetical protein PPOP_1225 [Paenibacillus popilliae ATCC 14706]|uniref:Uncharacterized protein n=1 Tax=Paenibacillus popilliae ATCC 14706 TaxID=1212764 RepID=M9M3Q1_PAEPP|nr:hypothetical protein PPOP_1225 [Paenibacillus popilliae ATCC 14706]